MNFSFPQANDRNLMTKQQWLSSWENTSHRIAFTINLNCTWLKNNLNLRWSFSYLVTVSKMASSPFRGFFFIVKLSNLTFLRALCAKLLLLLLEHIHWLFRITKILHTAIYTVHKKLSDKFCKLRIVTKFRF